MSTAAYSGSLQIKKKAELQEIAQALAISDNGTREDLQLRIKKHLEDNSSDLEADPAFTGLYTTRGGKRQRSLQPANLPHPTHNHAVEGSRFQTIAEERAMTPPADEMRDVSMMMQRSPGLPTPSSQRRASMSPKIMSLPVSPANKLTTKAETISEAQEAPEDQHSFIRNLFQVITTIRIFLSSGKTIFMASALLDFAAILFNIHVTSVFPIPPIYVSSEPGLSATALATFYWAIPSMIIPSIVGYLISFSTPTSEVRFDVLSAAIVRFAGTFVDAYPSMAFVEKNSAVISLDVLGVKWRAISSGVSLAFAFAEAIARRNNEA